MTPHQQKLMQFDIGTLVKGEESIHEISFDNEFGLPYNIRKITPFCPCIKILEYTDFGVFPTDAGLQDATHPLTILETSLRTFQVLRGEKEVTTKWAIKFMIKKTYLGKGSTNIDLILESPVDSERFVLITVNYNVISK